MTDPATPQQREIAIRAWEETIILSERSLASAAAGRRMLRETGTAGHDKILNAVEFVQLWLFDLGCLQHQMTAYSGTMRGQFFARCAALLVLESLKSLGTVIDHRFREEICDFMKAPALDGQLRELHSRAKRQYDASSVALGELRDSMLAHRDVDPDVRLKAIFGTTERDIVDHVIEAMRVLNELGALFAVYVERLGQLKRAAT